VADPFTVSLEEQPNPADVRAVHDGLDAFNLRFGPPHAYQPLTIFLRDDDSALVGGLIGATYWGWLYVEVLWLEERARRGGHGSAMLAAAEEEAWRRGCRHVHLDTMDWQALPFYQKRGYTVWGQLDDLPEGHTRYFLRKDLPAAS
jgi:GNAT superfamily N-acetyltransferase